MEKEKILIVDQDESTKQIARKFLAKDRFHIFTAMDQDEALSMVKRRLPHLVLLDFHIKGINGVGLVQAIKEIQPSTRILVFSGRSGDESGALASELGVEGCLVKPLNIQKLSTMIDRVLSKSNDGKDQRDLLLRPIIGESDAMVQVLAMAKKVAASSATILIQGASGTGKESVARAIHYYSHRREKPFVTINCAALPDGLLESELFGVCQGAYTGALANRPGKMQLADGGTLVLDEISEMPLSIQAKLLRAVQEKEVTPLGGGYPKHVDVRFVAVTNQDLAQKVREGKFREDLFFRLNVVSLTLPVLRERQSDISLLADHFLKLYSHKNKKTVKGFSREAIQILQAYSWPGNIRELENTIERAVILSDGDRITQNDFSPYIVDAVQRIFETEKKGALKEDSLSGLETVGAGIQSVSTTLGGGHPILDNRIFSLMNVRSVN